MTRRDEVAARVNQLDEQGFSMRQIARFLCISIDRVERILDPGAPGHGPAPCGSLLGAPEGGPAVITSAIPVSIAEVKRGEPSTARPGAGRPRKPREHGTMSGYGQHRYRKEPVCRDCLDAYNVDAAAKKGITS